MKVYRLGYINEYDREEPPETLSAGLSATLAHIISATSKSTVPAIMSFLVGI